VWGQGQFKAELDGYDGIRTLSTAASGQANVEISKDGLSVNATLTFSRLEGVAQFARLYIGKPAANGGGSRVYQWQPEAVLSDNRGG